MNLCGETLCLGYGVWSHHTNLGNNVSGVTEHFATQFCEYAYAFFGMENKVILNGRY